MKNFAKLSLPILLILVFCKPIISVVNAQGYDANQIMKTYSTLIQSCQKQDYVSAARAFKAYGLNTAGSLKQAETFGYAAPGSSDKHHAEMSRQDPNDMVPMMPGICQQMLQEGNF